MKKFVEWKEVNTALVYLQIKLTSLDTSSISIDPVAIAYIIGVYDILKDVSQKYSIAFVAAPTVFSNRYITSSSIDALRPQFLAFAPGI